MNNFRALDPKRSVVVEACAGSGKTWLLVSRIVRLLLDGVLPSQILAITFTRKAAQEMQARLQDWLRDLALRDDAWVRAFLAERGLEYPDQVLLQRARSLYHNVLLAQPGIAISTFHGWFMQVLQRAPLNSGVMLGMTLLERPGSLQQEAWEELLDRLRKQPDSAVAQHMLWLFGEYGLHNTRNLLFNFLYRRGEWWAYVQGQQDALSFALESLRTDLGVDMDFDAVADWGMCGNTEELLFAFFRQLANSGTAAQQARAGELEQAWSGALPQHRYEAVQPLLFTQAGEPRSFKPTRNQNAEAFLLTRDALFDSLQQVRGVLAEQQAYLLNEAVLNCGVALLDHYQALKQQRQQMDFADLEWQLCDLLRNSDHAETMQYKLDNRYRHVLLDEFQDTNPLQWQILRAWFDAAVAVESQPTVFIVGDPKQSIYRFRRADARLFGMARDYLVDHFGAEVIMRNRTRRNAPSVIEAVNAVFREQPEGFGFAEHETHQQDLPGHVRVLELAVAEAQELPVQEGAEIVLRNPLTERRSEAGEGARHIEARQLADMLQAIPGSWVVHDRNGERRAGYGDIMVLVRRRTHLQIYEDALRTRHIPYITSRRGGLLDTLEAEDVQALLMFLITPFADLALARVLRTPLFGCSDTDLMALAQTGQGSWWSRLQQLDEPSLALQRAMSLLRGWMDLADKLPVHDLLDRIYFEGDMLVRYESVLPPEMRARVIANLNTFMEIALSVDAGRYPSLPRFLQELRELRDGSDDAPDEGRLGTAGNAVRIYTVHEAKGLEAPIVWLLDANAALNARDGNDVLLDWRNDEPAPRHFSLYTTLASRGTKRAALFEQEEALQRREEMNLLYVAMTRAQQVLIVSGNSAGKEKEQRKKLPSWYDRISAAVASNQDSPLIRDMIPAAQEKQAGVPVSLPAVMPVGKRTFPGTEQQQRGIWLHKLLQYATEASTVSLAGLHQLTDVPLDQIPACLNQVQALIHTGQLQRFFDSRQFRRASNELAYVNAHGELKRIDRLVEFDGEVWVLDYKMGESADPSPYRKQVQEYCLAMQGIYPGKQMCGALIFADGSLVRIV